MNKVLIGIMVVVVGGIAGWYFFRSGVKAPGMQIGTENITPAVGSSGGNVTISEESTGAGSEKGGTTGDIVVTYTDSGYQPNEVTVKKGTKVTFLNDSTGSMWTASGVHPTHQLLPGFDQLKSVVKGGKYEYTFIKVGTWKYHNHVKPTDGGIVIVTE
jgi:plastocyanin